MLSRRELEYTLGATARNCLVAETVAPGGQAGRVAVGRAQ
jgi:hypothetical protein